MGSILTPLRASAILSLASSLGRSVWRGCPAVPHLRLGALDCRYGPTCAIGLRRSAPLNLRHGAPHGGPAPAACLRWAPALSPQVGNNGCPELYLFGALLEAGGGSARPHIAARTPSFPPSTGLYLPQSNLVPWSRLHRRTPFPL